MEKLKKVRTVLRSSFTKTVKILTDEIRKDGFNRGIIEDKFCKLENLVKDLKEYDKKITDCLLDADVNEEELTADIENAEQYSDEFITVQRLVNEKLSIGRQIDAESVISNNSVVTKNKRYKLPKIELCKFDGELINWLTFWSQFKKINGDEDIDDCDKFQYLLQSMQPGTRARELIESYPMTSQNYKKAVTALEQRFGNKDLLIEVYVRELLKLIISNVRSNGKDRLSVCKLFDKVEAHLRALESMGISPDANAAWLYPMVESCLSEDIMRAWQRSPLLFSDDLGELNPESRLATLLKFLKKEVESEEKLLISRRNFEGLSLKEEFRDERKVKKSTNIPTAIGLFASKEQSCVFCDKHHNSSDCLFARSWLHDEKIAKIREKRCCLRCLKPGHVFKMCKSFVRCHICNKGHHVILCPDLSLQKNEKPKSELPEVMQNNIANQMCSEQVTLMTLEVKVVTNKGIKRVRALMDCGSQKSYISEATVKELGLKAASTENIAHSLFGGSRIEPTLHNKYSVKIRTKSAVPTDYTFDFLEQKVICSDIPRLPKGPWLKELKRNRIWLSDMGQGRTKIDLLIGSNIYGRLLTGEVKQLKNGLTAVNSILGWTVCGQTENLGQEPAVSNTSMLISNLALKEMKIQDLWKLETIGIMDTSEKLSKMEEDDLAYDHFIHDLKRKKDGRYCVGLPWINYQPDIPSNRHVAEKRLFGVTRKIINWKKVMSNERLSRIKFKFIPPTAAWWCGWWERLIFSVKTFLVRVLDRSSLSCEELDTMLCDVEATVNSRPLTYIRDGAEDLIASTPGMFMQDTVEIGTPDLDSINQKKLALRYSYCQQLRDLRSRFRKEYLGQLFQKANGKFDDIKKGNVVLIGIDNQKRLNWPMAKVLQILSSRDGKARVVKLKTKNGTLVRPLQRLYPLEISSTDVICQQQEKQSRSGRLLKPPERL